MFPVMKFHPLYVANIIVLTLVSCHTSRQGAGSTSKDPALEQFQALLAGNYSSAAQAKRDTSYFNISLVMVPIWENRTDGKWLYVEQALASKRDKPYRQRVYRLVHPSKNVFTSEIYTIKEPLTYAGAQNSDSKMQKLTFDKIELKEGCTVTMTKKGDVYEGGTDGRKCPSDLRGATYATTKITLKPSELQSWDQGFNADGKKVWGATKGGYIFVKRKE
jgi:hypothetical protein